MLCQKKLLLTLLLFIPIFAWASIYTPQKVVYHINYLQESRINATFNNINNHIEALGEEQIDIKVVIHGPALEYFIAAKNDSNKQITIDSLKLQNVQFLICGNTIAAYRINREDLYEVDAEDVVQAGLPAIVALQQAGYIYVRP